MANCIANEILYRIRLVQMPFVVPVLQGSLALRFLKRRFSIAPPSPQTHSLSMPCVQLHLVTPLSAIVDRDFPVPEIDSLKARQRANDARILNFLRKLREEQMR